MLAARFSWDKVSLFAELYRLSAPFGTQFAEHPAGVRLYRAFADKQALGNFAVAQAGGNQPQNLQFTRCNAQLRHALLVEFKGAAAIWKRLNDSWRRFPCQREAKPDAER